MIQRDYLIIGGGIGGASACESIRKYDKRGSVTMISAEIFQPYKRWLLSKDFLRDKTPQIKKLALVDERLQADRDAMAHEDEIGQVPTRTGTR